VDSQRYSVPVLMSSGTGCDDTRPVKVLFVFNKQMENQEELPSRAPTLSKYLCILENRAHTQKLRSYGVLSLLVDLCCG
jgi:hypothetical protein